LTAAIRRTVTFPGVSLDRLQSMLGAYNGHLKQIEQRLEVKISHRGDAFFIDGEIDAVERAEGLLHRLHEESEINPRGANQKRYVQRILNSDISFGIGPAGTGKTYLAVAAAVDMLERNEIQRILLVRPAVEAGEKLGFLPGDLTQKIDPYLRPLYDALYEMLGFEKVAKLIERQVIEVAPLAYMRGRTLNHSFVILDEAQNTTPEQMKMFLTRLGFGSRAVIVSIPAMWCAINWCRKLLKPTRDGTANSSASALRPVPNARRFRKL